MRILLIFCFLSYQLVANAQTLEQHEKVEKSVKIEENKPKLPPRIPQTALLLAKSDWDKLPKELSPYCRYVWNAEGDTETYAAITFICNSVISRTSVEYSPEIIANGALLKINFLQLAKDLKTSTLLIELWDTLSFRDWVFSAIVEDKNGKKDKNSNTLLLAIPAPYLNTEFKPGLVYRSDFVVKQLLEANNGGFYYKFLGIVPGKTTLDEYLDSRSVNFSSADKAGGVQAATFDLSKVTGKPRKIKFWSGQGVQPTAGRSLAIITDDTFDNNNSTNANPFSSLLNNKPDGRELFVKKSNGYWEFSLWNGKGISVDEAPSNLVSDSTIPDGFTKTLIPGIGCIRCHANNSLIQPFNNQIGTILNGPAVILADNSSPDDFKNKQDILSLFNATNLDINQLIDDERAAINVRVNRSTKVLSTRYDAKEACIAIKNIYNKYEYERVTPKQACLEFGVVPSENDKNGINTLRTILPLNILGPESIFLIRLESDWYEPETKIIHTGTLTRREFEQIYQVGMVKAAPAIKVLLENNK